MKLSERGLDLIKKWEGCRLNAYKCPAGVWTIGYGHTKGVKKGDKITQDEADKLLLQDCKRFEDHVNTYNKKYNFTQNQFDALVSFAFNIGSIRQLTQNGKRTKYEIGTHIKLYVYSNGKKLQGLINRRTDEYKLYIKK